jgi:hypothetical protein
MARAQESAYVGDDPFLPPTSDPARIPPTAPFATEIDAAYYDGGFRGQMVAMGTYVALYGMATYMGQRYPTDGRFVVKRLETAYAYDLVGHVYVVRELAGIGSTVQQLGGVGPRRARNDAAWYGAFGSELYMEFLNGWVPGIRFDPLDPVANFVGAWLATGGQDLAARHQWLQRFSLQFGYQDWNLVFGPQRDDAFLGNIWHDHPNGRFGLGYDIGPAELPWFGVFASYEITSYDIEELKNRFGVGIELYPVYWLDPVLRKVPGGGAFLKVYDWLNQRILMPVTYVQLWHVDLPPFSNQQPFEE